MLQNAQMHQLVMQQMMLSTLPQRRQAWSQSQAAPVNRPSAGELRKLLAVSIIVNINIKAEALRLLPVY